MAHLSDWEKNGTFVYADRTLGNEPMSYHDIDAYLTAQLQPEADVA